MLFWAAAVLVALTACKNSVHETSGIANPLERLPRAETPEGVATAMEGFFDAAATDSFDIHSVMVVKDGNS